MSDVKAAVDKHADAFELFRRKQDERLDAFGNRIEELETRASAPSAGARKAASAEVKAFEEFIRTGASKGLEAPSTKEMSIAGGAADGGAMVPEVIANQIISRAIARSPILGVLRDTLATTSDYVRLVNLRGATTAWSDETSTRNATSTPMLREVRPTHGELYALPAVTNWLLQDSQFNVDSFLSENVSDTFAKSLEAAVLYGDGTSKPTGILNDAAVLTGDADSPQRDADAIQYVAATSDLADDLISLYFTLKPEYRRNAVFVMSSATLAAVRKLRDTNGSGYLWQPNLGGGVDASDGTLLGKRVITSEELPTLGNSPVSDAILCGDFMQGYELTRIGRMAVIRDQVTTPGKTRFYTAARFGGRLTDNDSIKVLRG
jgi:HK97 family phage major capsid protein